MKLGSFAMGLLLVLGAVAGCGNVCDDADDLCADARGDGEEAPNPDAAEVDCSGAEECSAQCVIDLDSCDYTTQALTDCVTKCAG